MGKTQNDKPTQKTPKGHEIPIPTRKDFLVNLEKAAKPKEDEEETSEESGTGSSEK